MDHQDEDFIRFKPSPHVSAPVGHQGSPADLLLSARERLGLGLPCYAKGGTPLTGVEIGSLADDAECFADEYSRQRIKVRPATVLDKVAGLFGPANASAIEKAKSFVEHALADGKPMQTTQLQAAAKQAGISPRTLRRSIKELKVRATKTAAGGWTSTLLRTAKGSMKVQ